MHDDLHAIGIMTGNSLDAADLVLSRFGADGAIADIAAHSVAFPDELRAGLRAVRAAVDGAGGWVDRAVAGLGPEEFERTYRAYMDLLVAAVGELRAKTPAGVAADVIGLHGQTCAHRPPSVAGRAGPGGTYTVQLGDGGELADRTGITVVCDFRSDDLMLGGEGAPLAPMHHRHLAALLRGRGVGPVGFANAGNTGNVSLIAPGATAADDPTVLGWDSGPFNHLPDRLMQLEAGRACDVDAAVGRAGAIHPGLLRVLFERSVATVDGANFLLQPPPRSGDPQWYRLVPEVLGKAPVDGAIVGFADRVRTATYFGPYVLAHSLGLVVAGAITPPTDLATCGGGWRNPLTRPDLRALLSGDPAAPVLSEHVGHFGRVRGTWSGGRVVASSDLGFDGTMMEARIFADAAACRVLGVPFTTPATTGAARPAICGLIRFPGGDRTRATEPLRAALDRSGTAAAPAGHPAADPRWSRATAGWLDRR